MGATSLLYFAVLRSVLKWYLTLATLLFVALLCVDGGFIVAGVAKIPTAAASRSRSPSR